MTVPVSTPRKAFDPALLVPPAAYPMPEAPNVRPDTLAKIQKITQHFSRPGFELPRSETSKDGVKAELSEREMMFLVRVLLCCSPHLCALSTLGVQSSHSVSGDVHAVSC